MSQGFSDAEITALLTEDAHMPACTRHLGFQIDALDFEANALTARASVREAFRNPNGSVQGGIVSAFLDEAMSAALLLAVRFTAAVPTLEMKTSFLRPLISQEVRLEAKVERIGRTFGFSEGRAFDADGRLCAIATATAALKHGDPNA